MIIAELSTDYNLSGGGDVRAESVVQRGKQGSGDQSPVTSPGYHYHTPHHTSTNTTRYHYLPVSLHSAVLKTTKINTTKCILIIGASTLSN